MADNRNDIFDTMSEDILNSEWQRQKFHDKRAFRCRRC